MLEEGIGPVRCTLEAVSAGRGSARFALPQLPTQAGSAPDAAAVAAGLALSPGDIDGTPARWSAGNPLSFVPIRSLAAVARCRPDPVKFEAAFGATNDNPHFGRCRNPHRLEFTPGGSSGGSAAAVAAGLAAAALGSDTLGSVRIPASYCGCAGFKPTRGSIPTAGLMSLSASLDEIGVLARSVGDCAAVFEAIRDAGSGTVGSRTRALERARVGVVTGLDVAPEIAAAIARTAAALGASACILADCDLAGIDLARVRRAGLLIAEAEGARVHARLLSDPASGISQSLREALAYGAAQAPERIAQARALLHEARRGLDALFASVDLLLLPTTPQTAFAFASPAPSNQADFTAFANAGGMPALSLAAGLSSEGLPLGVQLVAARGADALVLEAGRACEDVLGFFPPPMIAV